MAAASLGAIWSSCSPDFGPRAVHDRFAQLIATAHAAARADLPDLPEVPAYTFRAYVGAVTELVTDEQRQALRRGLL